MRIPKLRNTTYHATGGFLTVDQPPWLTPLAQPFLKSAERLGYPIGDCNGDNPASFSIVQATLRDGRRCSNAKAFLQPVRGRPNLHVVTFARVTRLLVNNQTKAAEGVVFDLNGKTTIIRALKEVVLSAGAINSPHLLMLSGIGPEKHLNDVSITVVYHSPGVGQDMQDHVGFGGLVFTLKKPVTLTLPKVASIASIYQYAVRCTGPLTVPSGVHVTGFAYSNSTRKNDASFAPDIDIHMVTMSILADFGLASTRVLNMNPTFYSEVYGEVSGEDSIYITPFILDTKSRGSVKLRSANPKDTPVVTSNYLTHPQDIRTLVTAIKMGVQLGQSPELRAFGAKLHDKPFPGCKMYRFGSDEYWECAARYFTLTGYHNCGTCKMGPSTDPMAVVDPELRVHGIGHLRVADASIMPIITRGNTAAPCTMIGEKAADMIKEAWLEKK